MFPLIINSMDIKYLKKIIWFLSNSYIFFYFLSNQTDFSQQLQLSTRILHNIKHRIVALLTINAPPTMMMKNRWCSNEEQPLPLFFFSLTPFVIRHLIMRECIDEMMRRWICVFMEWGWEDRLREAMRKRKNVKSNTDKRKMRLNKWVVIF